MSSREQIYLEETIKAMKKKIARDAIGKSADYKPPPLWSRTLITLLKVESDSDTEILAPTNRGNKLKQNAKFVREGKLGPPTGPTVYRQARSPVRSGFQGVDLRLC